MEETTGAVQLPEVTDYPQLDALVALITDASALVQGKISPSVFEESAAYFVKAVTEFQTQPPIHS